MDRAGHGKLGARWCFVAMVVTATAHRSLPWLELRQWQVSKVEEVMAELWVQMIEQWRCGGSERARRRLVTMARRAVASLGRSEGEREAERGE